MKVNIIIKDVEIDESVKKVEHEIAKVLSEIVYQLFRRGLPLIALPNVVITTDSESMSRERFMEAFRNDDNLAQELTGDDCEEVFLGILKGGSDITYRLLDSLCAEYDLSKDDSDFMFAKKFPSVPLGTGKDRPNRNPKPCAGCGEEITEPYPHVFLDLPYCDESAYDCSDCQCTSLGQPKNEMHRCGWCQLIADATAVVDETREEQGKI